MSRPTYHLVPVPVWAVVDPGGPYVAASLATEGFVHCTDGREALLATAERHFGDDPREYLALTIDLARAGSPWRIDDAAGIYPHVFGPIERAAITAIAPMVRDPEGRFVAIGQPIGA